MNNVIDLDCGIAYTRIANWLDNELALPRSNGEWLFANGGYTCCIHAKPLESRPVGRIALERTRLLAHGDPNALEAFNKLFTLRFISAGG